MELFNKLEKYDAQNTPTTRTELKILFSRLTYFYEDEHVRGRDADLTLPITVKDLKKVYKHLALLSEKQHIDISSAHFENRPDGAPVENSDLVVLFDKLTEHYAYASGRLAKLDVDALISLFSTLSHYYYQRDAEELGDIYYQMAKVFGRPSVFRVEDQEVQAMFDQMQDGEQIENDFMFEGSLVKDFEDLVTIQEK